MIKKLSSKYSLYFSAGLVIMSLVTYSCTNNGEDPFEELSTADKTKFVQDFKGLNSNNRSFNYTLAGMMHNEFLDCMINEISTWNEPESLEEVFQINEMLWEASNNCSFPWYSNNQGLQFSFDNVFSLDFLNKQVTNIMSSNAFSTQGKKIINKLTSYYFNEEKPSSSFLTNLITDFKQTKFSNSTEKQVVGSLLYLTQGSTQYWSENVYVDINNADTRMATIPVPVALDLAGAIVSVAMDAVDGELAADKIDDHIVSGAIASSGVVGRIGKWFKGFF